MLAGALTAGTACSEAAAGRPSSVVVSQVAIGEAVAGGNAALYAVFEQHGGDDEVVSASASGADAITVMGVATPMDERVEQSGFPISLGAGSTEAFIPGKRHLMLESLSNDLVAGDVVEVRFDFDRHEPVVVRAAVLDPDALLELVPRPPADEEEAHEE